MNKYKHLIALGLVAAASLSLALLGVPLEICFTLIALWQLSQFAMSKRSFHLYNSVLTPEQIKEFGDVCKELAPLKDFIPGMKTLSETEGGWAWLKSLPALFKDEQKKNDELRGQVAKMLKSRMSATQEVRPRGMLSQKAAEQLGAQFVLHLARCNKLDLCLADPSLRTALLNETRGVFGMSVEKTLSASDVPLPSQFFSEINALIAEYGVARNAFTMWPLSGGTDKPPRFLTRFTLSGTAMAAAITEKGLTVEFASLESHKLAGFIYTPRELREQSIIALGQYIARLAAVAAAQVEDEYAFLADGTGSYDSIAGVGKVATTNSKLVTLGSGKTKTSDVTVANLRAIFGKVNSRVRSTGVWYINNTWEAYLPELNTQANQYNFRYNNAGQALLFGRPIVWTEVLAAYDEDNANPGAILAVYGDLSYWWMGSRNGGLRIDESSDFAFINDLITTRMIAEFDFDYMATDAVAVVKTAAS